MMTGGAMGQGSTGAIREVEVRMCLGMLRNLADRVKGAAASVSERFSSGMRQEPANKERAETTKIPAISAPLAVELQGISNILSDAEEILSDALQRCEL